MNVTLKAVCLQVTGFIRLNLVHEYYLTIWSNNDFIWTILFNHNVIVIQKFVIICDTTFRHKRNKLHFVFVFPVTFYTLYLFFKLVLGALSKLCGLRGCLDTGQNCQLTWLFRFSNLPMVVSFVICSSSLISTVNALRYLKP